MAEDLQTTISVLAETGQATSNLGRLDQAFRKFFDDAGKTKEETKAFLKIAKDAEQGKVAVESLDAETRKLVNTYANLREVARARDTLRLIPHAKIKAEIADLRAAFYTLKQSGTLTTAELGQAAQETERRIAALSARTGGFADVVGNARTETAGFAKSAKDSAESIGGLGEKTETVKQKFLGLFSLRGLFIKFTIAIGLLAAGYKLAEKGAIAAAEAVARLAPAVRASDAALQEHRNGLIYNAAAAKQAAGELGKFATVQAQNAEQLLRLGRDERESYAARLASAREYHTQVLRAALAEAELGKDTKATQAAAGQALKLLQGDYKELEKAIRFAADAAKQGLNIDAAQAIEQFRKLRAESKSTEDALKAVTGVFDLASGAGIQSFSQALGELSVQGLAGAKVIGEAWDGVLGKFSGRELTAFAETAKAKLGESARDMQALADINDSVLRASLRALGEDAEKAIGGVSAAAADAIASIETVVNSGKLSGETLADAFNKAFAKLDTVKAVEQMKAVILAFGKDGKLSVAQVADEIDKLNERAADLTPGIQTVTEAYKTLGIEAPKALAAVADKARAAFEVIRDSGGSVEEIRRAFLAYAKAALAAAEATGKPADAMLRAQAAVLGLSADLGKLSGENQKVGASFEAVARAQDAAIKTSEAHVKAVEAEGRAAIATAQAELEQAKARNNAVEITKSTIALAETESAVAAKVAEAKLAAAAASADKVVAIEAEALADGKLTEAERELLAVAEEVAAAKQAEADAAQASADAKAIEAETAGKVAEAEQGVAISIEAAIAVQRDQLALTQEYGAAAADVYAKVAAGIEATLRDQNGLIELSGALIERLRRDSAEAAGDILKLTGALAAADAPTEALTRAAAQALEKYKDLGDEALAGLRAALDDARARTEALRDAAKSTVEQLRDQFDQLKGNDEALAKREYERKKAEIDARLKEAIAAGDRQAQKDLQEALRLLGEIRVEREKQRIAEAKADAARAKSGGGTSEGAPPPPSSGAGGGDIALTFNLTGDLNEETVRRKVIPILEKAARQSR